jgi:predicted ATPase/DNA-binding CsgD family transcriptional regulator
MTWPSRPLPDGTVTFLLTDVESSTAGWESDADAMAAAIGRHYALLDEAVATHDGVRPVEQGEGDSIVAAFARASDAVLAALDAQRALTTEAWPTPGPLRVRMAIHTGEGRLRDEGNYAGHAIIRAARLRAIAHGGQIVLSSTTRDLVLDDLAEDLGLVDLGLHRLKDLERPEHVWQLLHPELPADFPPLRSLSTVPNNLPVALSSFIGRFDAIDTVARLVYDNRLVTLTGPGGAGKTRLAQQVAAETLDAFPDGVWWVDLADVRDPELVPSAISRAAMLPEDPADRLGGLLRRLGPHRSLVVVDNCEHLVDACADVTTSILAASAGVAVLATSRAPLSVPGEISWQVPPMSVPTGGTPTDLGTATRSDAVRLFADRAAQMQGTFELTDANVGDVVEICRRLDGIPLAIELAAARTRVLTTREIVDGLADAMGLLASGRRRVLARHATIEASIRWSHALLTPDEQRLLRRLAVFEGAFTVDAARAVTADDTLPAGSALTLLEGLVDQSLVQRAGHLDRARFRLLATVRQFARAELDQAGELEATAARHAVYFAARGRSLWPLFEPNMGELLDQSEAEFADLSEMLSYLERKGSPEEHAEVAMACLPAMSVRHAAEAAALGDRVVPRIPEASVLAGRLHLQLALVDPASPHHVGAAIAAAEATGDPDLLVQASFWSASQGAATDPTPEVLAALHAAYESMAAIGENHFSRAHWMAAGAERAVGRTTEAEADWALAATQTICKRCNVIVWSEGALLALARGDLEAARENLARAQAFGHEVRDAAFLACVRLTEAEVAAYAGGALPTAGIEADLRNALASGHPLAIGFTSEARAIVHIANGALPDADADLVQAMVVDDMWPKRTEARLRRAAIHHALGDHEQAAAILAELRDGAARWDAGPWLLAQIDQRAAALALDADDSGTADQLAHQALAAAAAGPWPPLVIRGLELLATVAVARESHLEAARLAGAARRQRELVGYRLDPEPDRSRRERALAKARETVGSAGFEAAWDEGAQLSLDDAVAYAQRARGERKRPSYGWDGLTPTERQVADLAVQGLTNAQIADRLFVGRETVKTHLSNVYAKVGVANRTQLVADAARRG